jgi:hypothetical protein
MCAEKVYIAKCYYGSINEQLTNYRAEWCMEDKEPCNTIYGSMKTLLESKILQAQQKVQNTSSNGG